MRAVFRSLPLILLTSLALRLGYAWNYRDTHTRQALATIPFLFEPGNIAASLVDGKGFSSPLRVESGPTAWMTPVYPLLLAGIFRVFGTYTYRSWEAAVSFNILFGVLTCVPVFLIGRRIGGPRVAAVAAWLWAVFPNALMLPTESLWDASLAALAGACLVFFTLRVSGFQSRAHWVAYGLLWGLALMISATLGLALPFLLIWMGWRGRNPTGPAVAACVAVLCCVPWTVRNFLVLHAFVPLRSVGGVSLWLGTIDPDLGRWPASFHPLADSAERARFLQSGEIAYMHEKESQALTSMAAQPGTEIRLSVQRFVALWAGGALHPLDAFARSRSIWFRFVLAFNIALAIAGLVGTAMLWKRRSRDALAVAALPLVIPLAFYFTLALPRYRLLVDPEVAVLAAWAFVGSNSRPSNLVTG